MNARPASESRCPRITDEEVELYVMGRLQNDAMAEHLGSCPKCASRVATIREHVALMKAALNEILRPEKRALTGPCSA
jgi:anti-sigma factor RsiW